MMLTVAALALTLSAPLAPPDSVPLYDDLGDHHRVISTSVPMAQAYFDQGLRLQYAFNHAEAIRSYRAALERDPKCAACWWGIALALGPNINAPMDSTSGAEALRAIGEAKALEADASPVERALIDALAERYGGPTAVRVRLDSAYARAMAGVAADHPDDPDVLTLYAASLMNLSPWNYWTGEYGSRKPRPDTPTILANLEHALSIDADHPGACHYYIHAVEAGAPEKAVACADRLAALMPGAGHIVHMPGHVYIRVGRYADAVRANEHAVHTDESYIHDQRPEGIYPSGYYPHNYHFLTFAATMAGMSAEAVEGARKVSVKVPLDIAKEVYWVQSAIVMPQLTMVTFGRWDDALAEPMPRADLVNATVMAHYARGVALAATGRADEARAELAAVQAIERDPSKRVPSAEVVPAIALHALEGEIALRTGDPAGAVEHFEIATAHEDSLQYDEPPLWFYPLRHSLGRALLEAGRPAEAEAAYRQDLLKFPANGWSLFGLTQALEAQGKADEAAAARAEFDKAWKDADVTLTASRF